MPNYFSGTNCRASGNGQIPGAVYSAYLKLNGELVASYEHIWSEPFVNTANLKVMFDSSHFPDGTTVTVRLEINGYDSGPYIKTGAAVVRNRAMFYEDPDPAASPDGSLVMHNLFNNSGYSRLLQNGGSWSESAYFSSLDGSNFAVLCGHGTASSHETGTSDSITPSEYESVRMSQVGIPVPPTNYLPPFNYGAPPVNLLYLIACKFGMTSDFTKCLWPHVMAWGGPFQENQSALAYKPSLVVQQLSLHAELVGPLLRQGQTTLVAVEQFDAYLDLYPGVLRCWDHVTGAKRDMQEGDLVVYGDTKTRVKSVYTGTNVEPLGWFRPL